MFRVLLVVMAHAPPNSCHPGNLLALVVTATTANGLSCPAARSSGWWCVSTVMADQKDDDTPPGSPPPETLRALNEQSTPELWQEARRFAEGRARLVRRAGRPVSRNYARELVDDAHADTWSGELPWDPSRCSLLAHLRRAIKRRTWREVRHANQVPLVSLHGASNDGSISSQVEHVLAHASSGDCGPIMLCVLTDRVCRALRTLVPHDGAATAVVQSWETGCIEHDEVMERTGLSEDRYERARRRLLYMSRHLPPELRETAQELLRSAS